jgi:hypothetical protein
MGMDINKFFLQLISSIFIIMMTGRKGIAHALSKIVNI